MIYSLYFLVILLAIFILYLAFFTYEPEQERFTHALENTWINYDDRIKNEEFSHRHLKNNFIKRIKGFEEAMYKNRSTLFFNGTAIIFTLLPWLCYRVYFTFLIHEKFSTFQLLCYTLYRVIIIWALINILFKSIQDKRTKAINAVETLPIVAFSTLFIIMIYSLIQPSSNSGHFFILAFQLLLCFIVSIFSLKLLRNELIYLSNIKNSIGITFLLLAHFILILFYSSYIYLNLATTIFTSYGTETMNGYIDGVNLTEQIFSATLVPIIAQFAFLVIWLGILMIKPLILSFMRVIYAIQRYEFIKQKKLLFCIAVILLSFIFPIIKIILEKIEIGL